jgi:hypothetical protein
MNAIPLPDDATVRIDKRESPADSPPANARHRIRHIAKSGRFRGADEFAGRPLTQWILEELVR